MTNYQKISAIEKTDRTIRFRYNPMQQRVAKYVKPDATAEKRTYYVRDAQGNVLATYSAWVRDSAGITWDSFALAEQHIYGSSRVGYTQPGLMLYPAVPVNPHALDSCHYVIFEGWKRYEISNHLGNVLAVVTDRKRGRASSGTNIQWFVADVLSAQQYYPFGMLMPGNASTTLRRQYSLNSYDYRYGFNGKEGDDEVKGDDNQQDYGMRIYDPRVSRFLSVDPIAREYPWNSPYTFAENDVLRNIDLDGAEKFSVTLKNAKLENGKASIEVSTYVEINLRIINLSSTTFTDQEKAAISQNIQYQGNIFDGRFQNQFALGLAFDPKTGKQILNASNFVKLFASGYLNVDIKSSQFVNDYPEIESKNTLILAIVDDVPANIHKPGENPIGVYAKGSYVIQVEGNLLKPKIEKTNNIPIDGISTTMHELGHSMNADHTCDYCSELMSARGSRLLVPEKTRSDIASSLIASVLKTNKNILPFNKEIKIHFDYTINPKKETEKAIYKTNSKTKQ